MAAAAAEQEHRMIPGRVESGTTGAAVVRGRKEPGGHHSINHLGFAGDPDGLALRFSFRGDQVGSNDDSPHQISGCPQARKCAGAWDPWRQ